MPDLPTRTRAVEPGTERLLHLRQRIERAARGMRTRFRIDILRASSACARASRGRARALRAAASQSDPMRSSAACLSLGLNGRRAAGPPTNP